MENSNYSLTYRKDLGILVLRWKDKGSTGSIVQSYEQAINLAVLENTRFWLLDLRGRDPISPTDAQWVKHTFFPTVEQKLNKSIFIAYLLPPTLLEHLWQHEGFQEEYIFNQIQTRVFTSENLAVGWLADHQLAQANIVTR